MNTILEKKNAWLMLALALTALFIGGCSKNANTGNSTNSSNSATTTNKATTTDSPATTAAGSPMAVLKAFNEASDKKDYEGAKSHLSASSITYLEEKAKKKGKTLEQDFRESRSENAAAFPLSNEKITGDTATVDMKTPGPMVTVPFVKENGEWKLAIDKYMESDNVEPKNSNSAGDDDEDDAPKEK
jgi:uncharacterized protein YyaL (SSP411 family)